MESFPPCQNQPAIHAPPGSCVPSLEEGIGWRSLSKQRQQMMVHVLVPAYANGPSMTSHAPFVLSDD